jgi:hypothetical protein
VWREAKLSDPAGTVGAMVNVVLGALIAAVLALASQLLIWLRVVPSVDARKRREDRWERSIRDFLELMKTSLSDRATDAHSAQGLYGDLRKLESEPGQDRDRIAGIRADHVWETRKATRAFTDLAHTRVGLLTDEIVALMPDADELFQFETLARKYWLRVAMVAGWNEDDAEAEIDKRWDGEYRARVELIKQARQLADLRHPPRVSPLRRWWRWTVIDVRHAIIYARAKRAVNAHTL